MQDSVKPTKSFVGGGGVALEVVHDDGGFDSALCAVEEFGGGFIGEGGECHDGAHGAVGEFVAGVGVEVHHEVLMDFAEPDHGEGGDGVEDQFGGGSGFHAG